MQAAVSTVGDVSPAPPVAGGSFVGPLLVGNTSFGQMTVATPTGQTPTAFSLSSGSLIVGQTTTGQGILTLAGFGSNFSTTGANDVIIGNAGSGSIALSLTAQLITDDLTLAANDGASGSLFAADFGTLIKVTDTVLVGQAGTSLVQLSGGSRLSADDTVIGQNATGDGRIVVTGFSTLWQQVNSMTVGDAGRGDLQVLAQGRMENTNVVIGNAANSVGLALVDATGSLWETTGFMNIGVSGTAALRIFNGGRATVSGAARLATLGGSEATVEINGANSTWAVGTTITVGETGFGTVNILSGGRVSSTNVVLGDNVGSRGDVTVLGTGSLWEITGTLDVSEPGEARLAIATGGRVTTTGLARIAAAGELALLGGRLEVGSTGLTNSGLIQGDGRITGNVTNAAAGKIRVRASDHLILASTLMNSGVVDVEGGELEILGSSGSSGDIDARGAVLRFSGGLNQTSGGQMAITAGNVDVFGAVINAAGAQIVVGAEAHAVFHDTVTNNGQLFVMPGANALMLENLSFSATSALTLQLGGADLASDVPAVEVGGAATLAGGLQVSLAGDFEPELGDSFQVLTAAGGRSGTFAAPSLPTLDAGLAWDITYSSTAMTLSVIPGLTADFDFDHDVDANDLAEWRAGFGASSGATQGDGDANGDGDVDGADFLAWQSQFGASTAGGGALGAAVPEPASAACFALAWAAILARAGRFRRNR